MYEKCKERVSRGNDGGHEAGRCLCIAITHVSTSSSCFRSSSVLPLLGRDMRNTSATRLYPVGGHNCNFCLYFIVLHSAYLSHPP